MDFSPYQSRGNFAAPSSADLPRQMPIECGSPRQDEDPFCGGGRFVGVSRHQRAKHRTAFDEPGAHIFTCRMSIYSHGTCLYIHLAGGRQGKLGGTDVFLRYAS